MSKAGCFPKGTILSVPPLRSWGHRGECIGGATADMSVGPTPWHWPLQPLRSLCPGPCSPTTLPPPEDTFPVAGGCLACPGPVLRARMGMPPAKEDQRFPLWTRDTGDGAQRSLRTEPTVPQWTLTGWHTLDWPSSLPTSIFHPPVGVSWRHLLRRALALGSSFGGTSGGTQTKPPSPCLKSRAGSRVTTGSQGHVTCFGQGHGAQASCTLCALKGESL